MARAALTKKVRFEAFKRDAFTCQYCGAKSPVVVLEIDHIDPISKGGDNRLDNLITSCFDCNRGKSDRLLSAVPEAVSQRAEILKLKAEQIKEFNRLMKAEKRKEAKYIKIIEDLFRTKHPFSFADCFKKSLSTFLRQLPFFVVESAMETALARVEEPENVIKYFCGICWRTIKDDR